MIMSRVKHPNRRAIVVHRMPRVTLVEENGAIVARAWRAGMVRKSGFVYGEEEGEFGGKLERSTPRRAISQKFKVAIAIALVPLAFGAGTTRRHWKAKHCPFLRRFREAMDKEKSIWETVENSGCRFSDKLPKRSV